MLRSPSWALTWSVLRIVMAAVILAAIVAQLIASMTRAAANDQDTMTVGANFFSYFTILSNAAAAAVLVLAAVWWLTAGRRGDFPAEPRGIAVALASVTTYMIITGIVYNILLRNVPLYEGTEPIPWSNETLHLIAPIFLLLDLLLAPKRRGLAWKTVAVIAIFPILWVVYTLVRGPLITNPSTGDAWWYPYPFLNPHNFANGYGGVALYVVGIAVAIIAIGLFVVWVGRAREDERADEEIGDPRFTPAGDA